MAHIVELAEKWSEQCHAALAYLAEVVDEFYPSNPDESDPWRIRAEKALVRRADEVAKEVLQPRVTILLEHGSHYFHASRHVRLDDHACPTGAPSPDRGLRGAEQARL